MEEGSHLLAIVRVDRSKDTSHDLHYKCRQGLWGGGGEGLVMGGKDKSVNILYFF